MSRIEVWSPSARRVELLALGKRLPLTPKQAGMWQLEDPHLVPGSDYAFSLDGGPPLPDPRSRCQPEGVHAASRLIARDFEWTDADFRAPPLSSAILYELHVGTFASDGTFDGVIDRLPHLEALGVTHIELMPINAFPGERGWGYDGVSLFAPHRAYGGPGALKRLVDACHARKIAVVLDVVYNHLGPDGNYLPQFGPYLTDAHRTPWGAAVNLDGPHSDRVRRFFIDNALYWFQEFHLDGLRLDAVHALFDRSARHFLRQLSEEVSDLSDALAKPLTLIAESDLNDPGLIRAREANGFGLCAVWNDDFHHALHTVLTGERQGYYRDFGSLSQLAQSLERGFVYAGQYSEFRKLQYGQALPSEVSLRKLVGFLQNHDQVGNRARGERIGHLIPARRARLGAALVLLGPFVPLVFQGEEWNASAPFLYFTDHGDPELARAVREGRRREFADFAEAGEALPDPQALSTFQASCLDFSEISRQEHASVFEFYCEMIQIRQRREFRSPRVRAECDEAAGWLTLRRENSLVAVNFGESAVQVVVPEMPAQDAMVLHASEGAALRDNGVWLPPDGLAVIAWGL